MSSNDKERHFFQSTQKSYRIDLTLLYLSGLVLALKVIIGYWPEVVSWCCSNNGNLWSAILLPLQWILSMVCSRAVIVGCLLSTFSWQITYLNSHKPGVNPPSPMSPLKYRRKSGSDWHINYAFATLIGPLVSLLLLLGVA